VDWLGSGDSGQSAQPPSLWPSFFCCDPVIVPVFKGRPLFWVASRTKGLRGPRRERFGPGRPGLPAIEDAIAHGISVHIVVDRRPVVQVVGAVEVHEELVLDLGRA